MSERAPQKKFPYEEILQRIPLDRCHNEREFVTGLPATRAPEGYVFSVKGKFTIFYDEGVSRFSSPTESRELFLEENQAELAYYLKKAGGDQEEAWEMWEEDDEYFREIALMPESFEGQWLVIDPKEQTLTLREKMDAWLVETVQTVPNPLDPADKGSRFEEFAYDVDWQHDTLL